MEPVGLDLVETELSLELFRWGQATVAAPVPVRGLGLLGLPGHSKHLCSGPRKWTGGGRLGAGEGGGVDSWRSLMVGSLFGNGVTPPTTLTSGCMPLPDPEGY